MHILPFPFLLPFPIRKVIVHALVYRILRYGITVFYHCSLTWRVKVNSILKHVLQSVAYNLDIPPEANLFSFLQLPSFDALFFHCVIHRHFCHSDFLHPHVPARVFRHCPKFSVPRCYTRFGCFRRNFYVPTIFNSLPDEIFCLTSK
ncbi:unnamed protein product, partial [Ixodes hexagonus]